MAIALQRIPIEYTDSSNRFEDAVEHGGLPLVTNSFISDSASMRVST